jgi:tetratricopeptide (TPR) repeat protein
VVAHTLAVALWCAGDVDRAVSLLDQALERLAYCLGPEPPMRTVLLATLGEIMLEQRHLEQACVIHREVLECYVQQAGANHPSSLAAKGDLATVLFELGQNDEAVSLEREAFESAQAHLGNNHPVTSVLAWHRVLSYERCGDPTSSRNVFVGKLAWLLQEDPSCLGADQKTIRALLAERFHWDSPSVC